MLVMDCLWRGCRLAGAAPGRWLLSLFWLLAGFEDLGYCLPDAGFHLLRGVGCVYYAPGWVVLGQLKVSLADPVVEGYGLFLEAPLAGLVDAGLGVGAGVFQGHGDLWWLGSLEAGLRREV